jgi:VCBS repeat-containing protein
LFALLFAACDWFDYPLDVYHAEQTGTLAVETVRAVADHVALGTDGYVCVAPGTQTIVIPLDNPLGYAVREDGLAGFPSGLPAGVTVRAAQSADKNSIEITVNGIAMGHEFPISLTVKTAKEGRLLARQTLNVACVDFETRLDDLSVSWGTLSFHSDQSGYAINNIPVNAETISYTSKNSAAKVSISGGLEVQENRVMLAVGDNMVTVRVTAAHGAASREYRLLLTRILAPDSRRITGFVIKGNEGVIDESSKTITVAVPYETDITSCSPKVEYEGASYHPTGVQDFTNSAATPVTYTVKAANETEQEYTVTVTKMANTNADLTGLTVSSGTLSPTFSGKTVSSYTVNVANSVTSITVTASKSDAYTTISMNGTEYNSGTTASKTIDNLAVGDTTVPIVVTAEDGSTKTYTITVHRISNNANLTGLSITAGAGTLSPAFSPAFDANITAYTAGIVVDPAGNDMTVTAEKSGPYTKISIGGTDYNAGTSAEKTVSLSPGPNGIPVIVTAEDGTTKTYTIGVTVYGVTTLAGSGTAGFNDGTGMGAQFNLPVGVAVDSSGNVYVADSSNHRIRKIDSDGVVSTLAGSGTAGSVDGTGTAAQFNSPWGVAVDSSGNVYVVDRVNFNIRKITPGGVVTTLAGYANRKGKDDGTGTEALFDAPTGAAVDSSGNVYVADTLNHNIRKITPAGVVSTFAGSGTAGSADGTGTAAQFHYPCGVAVDSSGNVYVADMENHNIRKITPAGVVSTFAGSGTSGYGDGTSTAAQFNNPTGVAVDSAGNVYVADSKNYRIRKIIPMPSAP